MQLCISVHVPEEVRDMSGLLKGGVTGSCELSNVGAGN